MRGIWALLLIVLLAVAVGLCYLLLHGDRGPSLPVGQVAAPALDVSSYSAADLPEGPPPAADAIVFDMAYRGLSGEKDDLRYNSWWGFGHSADERSPFLDAVRKTATGNIECIRNDYFKGAEWAAVEFKEKQPIAFYFDLNADGTLDDFERILASGKADQYGRVEFITPDFLMTTREGARVPFRTILQVRDRNSPMWSPSCVLEGAAKVGGRDANLVLYTNGFSGSFIEFGRSTYTLKDNEERAASRHSLSSLINYREQFYRLRFLKHPHRPGAIRAVMEEDTTPTGGFAIRINGSDNLKARLSSGSISGAGDDTIRFQISGGLTTTLPQGEYKLDRGYVYYGPADADEYYVDFTKGPALKIVAGETCTVDIGKPLMTVGAIDIKMRYQSNVEDRFSYSKGTVVFLSPRIEGIAGEKYGRFTADRSSRRTDVEPTFEIVDSGGKRVSSGKMEYG